MNKNVRIIIIHGSFGSPDENWFPWLSKELAKKHINTIRPSLPTPSGQKLSVWRHEFNKQIGFISKDTILVGHSLAPAFIFHLLQDLDHAILGTILVAPFITKLNLEEFDNVNGSFIKGPFNWNKIKRNAGFIKIYAGDNDPYVPKKAVEEVSHNLNCEITFIKNGGHINTEAGFRELPVLLDDIVRLAKK